MTVSTRDAEHGPRDVVRRYEGVFQDGDRDAMRALFDPDAVFTVVGPAGEVAATSRVADAIDGWVSVADPETKVSDVRIRMSSDTLAVVELDFIHPRFSLHDVLVVAAAGGGWRIVSKLSG